MERVTRGPLAIALFVGVFNGANALDDGAGLLLASTWLLFMGSYCVLNFWHCREAHCAVTGPGWLAVALLGFAAAALPGSALAWYEVQAEIFAALAVLALGYGLQGSLAMRSSRRARH